MKYKIRFCSQILFICLALSSVNVHGQGIGDNLAFQGVTNQNLMGGVKARAMGNAYTAISGDINTIFYNPAGLADIENIQFSISSRNNNAKTFERQQFIPVGGQFGIMELIWAGIYTPQLKDDGVRSDKIKYDRADFTKPDSAVNFFDEDFADWIEENNSSGINNIMLAVPFNAFDRKFVVSAVYSKNAVYDFDKNEHVLGTDWGLGRVLADSNWYIYKRERIGKLNTIIGALATKMSDRLDVGVSFEYMSSNTNDELSNEIFAHMQIQQEQNENRQLPENTYYFWHDSTTFGISGKSKFSSFNIGIGAIYKSDKTSFGLKINLPYTLKRTHDYQEYKITKFLRDSTAAPITELGNVIKGSSKFKAPFSFALGFTIKPTDFIRFSLDYKINPFSKGSYEFTGYDSTVSKWDLPNIKSFQSVMKALPDLNSFHAGVELKPIKYVSLLAGYSKQSEPLRPEDHFKAEKIGAKSQTYSVGISISIPYAVLDFAYVWKNIKYIDYYSFHTDYVMWKYRNLFTGITFNL